MTDRIAALAELSDHQVPKRQTAFDDFYRRYRVADAGGVRDP
jgi:hypothetical protein